MDFYHYFNIELELNFIHFNSHNLELFLFWTLTLYKIMLGIFWRVKYVCLNQMHQSKHSFTLPFVLLSGVAQVNKHMWTVSSVYSVSDYNGLYLLLMQCLCQPGLRLNASGWGV